MAGSPRAPCPVAVRAGPPELSHPGKGNDAVQVMPAPCSTAGSMNVRDMFMKLGITTHGTRFPARELHRIGVLRESLLICIVVSDDLEYLAPHQ